MLPTPIGDSITAIAVNQVKSTGDQKLAVLASAISQIVSGYAKDIHGNAGDDRYRYIVDLIMTRIKIYLTTEFTSTLTSSMLSAIMSSVSSSLKNVSSSLKAELLNAIAISLNSLVTKDDIKLLKAYLQNISDQI